MPKKPTPPGPTGGFKNDITNVAVIIDRSGSMQSCWPEAINYTKNVINNLVAQAAAKRLETRVTLAFFNGELETIFQDLETWKINNLDEQLSRLIPTGGTRLWDSVSTVVARMKTQTRARSAYAQNSYLVIIVTDGGDTYHGRFGEAPLAASDNWTFTAACPPGTRGEFVARGFDSDNVVEWEATRAGVARLSTISAQAFTKYMDLRSSGATKSYAFYADASAVGARELRNLTRVAKRPVEVKSESLTRAFAEEYTGKPYVLGSLYYRLDKPEKVQAHKEMLLWHKKDKALYGSSAKTSVRDILGLASSGEIKVTPGNHGDFEIYVQSTSPVRKLPSHTKVVIL